MFSDLHNKSLFDMRKISPAQILTFVALFGASLILGITTANLLFGQFALGDFRGIVLVFASICCLYLYAITFYRLFLVLYPFPAGEIAKNSRAEFSYHVYLLFYLILFYPIMRSGFVPISFMRLFYQALGARLGENTYSSGIILDPPFIEIGDNSLVGQFALLVPHAIENDKLAHYPIRIGHNVTIGAHSVVLAGCTIEDGALVATGAVVKKGTHIGPGEVWGGVPAKLIRKSPDQAPTTNA